MISFPNHAYNKKNPSHIAFEATILFNFVELYIGKEIEERERAHFLDHGELGTPDGLLEPLVLLLELLVGGVIVAQRAHAAVRTVRTH
jgi:hypothetical protein